MTNASSQWKAEKIKLLSTLCDDKGNVSRSIAHDLIRSSAWWENHHSGPVPAPKHAENIEGSCGSWTIAFGANTFLISKATCRCCSCIKSWIQSQNGKVKAESWASLYQNLSKAIRSSVANYKGEEFTNYTAGRNNIMLFGSQSIRIDLFIKKIWMLIKIDGLNFFLRTDHTPQASKPTQKRACFMCGAAVHPEKLVKHMKEKCPQRHKYPISTDGAFEQAARLARPITNCNNRKTNRTNSNQTFVVTKKATCTCPWCGVSLAVKNLDKHKSTRCPKKPSSPAE